MVDSRFNNLDIRNQVLPTNVPPSVATPVLSEVDPLPLPTSSFDMVLADETILPLGALILGELGNEIDLENPPDMTELCYTFGPFAIFSVRWSKRKMLISLDDTENTEQRSPTVKKARRVAKSQATTKSSQIPDLHYGYDDSEDEDFNLVHRRSRKASLSDIPSKMTSVSVPLSSVPYVANNPMVETISSQNSPSGLYNDDLEQKIAEILQYLKDLRAREELSQSVDEFAQELDEETSQRTVQNQYDFGDSLDKVIEGSAAASDSSTREDSTPDSEEDEDFILESAFSNTFYLESSHDH